MIADLQTIHWIAGVIVLAEALNKLERTAPCRRGLAPRERVTEWLKAIAWALLAFGGAGAFAAPLLPLLSLERAGVPAVLMPTQTPTLQDVCIAVGFAVLIIRTRIKEG